MLVTRGRGYVLNAEHGQLDVDQFETLVTEGRDALSAGDAQLARDRLRQALALWRGPALADFAYEPFAQGEAARLEEERLAALEDRIDADLALGRHAELVGELDALVREHPLRECLHAQLMLTASFPVGGPSGVAVADGAVWPRNARRPEAHPH